VALEAVVSAAGWPYDGDYVRVRHGRITHIDEIGHSDDAGGWVRMACCGGPR
jgi:hypothetical protein